MFKELAFENMLQEVLRWYLKSQEVLFSLGSGALAIDGVAEVFSNNVSVGLWYEGMAVVSGIAAAVCSKLDDMKTQLETTGSLES